MRLIWLLFGPDYIFLMEIKAMITSLFDPPDEYSLVVRMRMTGPF